jgi:thiamine-phosphate pyrophosphorylase
MPPKMPKTSELAPRLRGLYAVTPDTRDTRALVAGVAACIAGGAAMVQYRAKGASPAFALEQARALAALCRARRVPLIVNDSPELALDAGADGVHLGRDDPDVREARARFPAAIIGVSCYAQPERAREAAEGGADYVAIGSVFASPTKPAATRAPLDLLGAAKRLSGLPVVAIGGITPANAGLAIAAGADMVAVISAVFDADDVAAASRAFARLFENSPDGIDDVRKQPQSL